MNTAYMYVQIFFTHCTITCKRTKVNAVFMTHIKHETAFQNISERCEKKGEDTMSSKVFRTTFD